MCLFIFFLCVCVCVYIHMTIIVTLNIQSQRDFLLMRKTVASFPKHHFQKLGNMILVLNTQFIKRFCYLTFKVPGPGVGLRLHHFPAVWLWSSSVSSARLFPQLWSGHSNPVLQGWWRKPVWLRKHLQIPQQSTLTCVRSDRWFDRYLIWLLLLLLLSHPDLRYELISDEHLLCIFKTEHYFPRTEVWCLG